MKRYNIYIDFDGVIAKQEGGYKREIGEPIIPMINKVNQWIKDGHNITIFTARADYSDSFEKMDLEIFLAKHFGKILPITNKKSHNADLYIDDKAIRCIKNTGILLDDFEEIEKP